MTDLIQYENKRLINIEAAAQLLAEAKTIEEVTEIRNYAEAVRLVAKQAKAGLQAQNEAAEIKLRAERRAGEMLAQIERVPPAISGKMGRDKQLNRGDSSENDPTYTDIVKEHIGSTSTAHNWQRIARIPEQQFDEFMKVKKENDEELTTAKVSQYAEKFKPQTSTPRPVIIQEPTEWDKAPDAKVILDIVMKSWKKELNTMKKTSALDKISPEAKRFLAKKVMAHIDLLYQWIEELENGN